METEKKHILFAGGGTAGPVTPLLAVIENLQKKNKDVSFHWVGTKSGPEKDLVATKQIPFSSIVTVKLDRFFSIRNFFMPCKFLFACVQSLKILRQEKPDLIMAAGGFPAVPVIFMAKVLGIETMVHQLDVRPTLSNKLVAPVVDKITVTFQKSLADFPQKKTIYTGSPIRAAILEPKDYRWELKENKPVVLIFGGGTGAQGLNELVFNSLEVLTEEAQIIHLTGKGKGREDLTYPGYFQFEFLRNKMGSALAKADLVVTRAGIGTLMELAALEKPAILVPLPNSHQYDNTDLVKESHAAMILEQESVSPQVFAETVLKLLKDEERKASYSKSIAQFYVPNAAELIVDEIWKLLYK